LIEVLVALTLVSLIATMLVSGTRLSIDVSERGNARAEAIRTEQTVRYLLRSQLQGALPFRYWTGSGTERVDRVAFEGESNRIRFVSRHGVADGPDSLPRWVDLKQQEGSGDLSRLAIEEHRILSPDNQPGEAVTARAETLSCTNVRFEYLDLTGEKPQWVPAWNGRERRSPIPFAVRITCNSASQSIALLIPLHFADAARQGLRLQ
jgi:type II secretory pathway pseudopilin PulG